MFGLWRTKTRVVLTLPPSKKKLPLFLHWYWDLSIRQSHLYDRTRTIQCHRMFAPTEIITDVSHHKLFFDAEYLIPKDQNRKRENKWEKKRERETHEKWAKCTFPSFFVNRFFVPFVQTNYVSLAHCSSAILVPGSNSQLRHLVLHNHLDLNPADQQY